MTNKYFTTTYTCDNGKKVWVRYTYYPGQPERGPSYSCGGEPAEPPSIEVIHIKDEANLEVKDFSEEEAIAIDEYVLEQHQELLQYREDEDADWRRGFAQDE